MIITQQPPAHSQHFAPGRFGFRLLAPVSENDGKIPQRFRYIQMLVSKQSTPDCQAFARQGFGLGEFLLSAIYCPQRVERRRYLIVFVAEKSAPNRQGLSV